MESLTYESEDLKSAIYNNTLIVDIEDILSNSLKYIDGADIFNKDIQKIFLNYFIIEICECLKKQSSIKTILFINKELPLINVYEADIYLKLIEKTLSILNIPYIKKPSTLTIFFKKILEKSDSELISIDIAVVKFKKNKSINKIISFFKKNGLKFLYETYFKDPSNKLVLFK